MHSISKTVWAIALLTTLMLVQACSLANRNPPTPLPPAISPEPIDPILTATSSSGKQTPSSGELRSCPVPGQDPAGIVLEDPVSAEQPLLDYLNTGGSLSDLSLQLTADAMVPASGSGFVETPMNPDNLLDLVILLVQPDSANLHPSGRLYVFLCEQDRYRTVIASAVDENYFNPQVHTIQDMNGDALSEIVFSESTCGAHTCFASTQILSWQDNALQNLLAGTTEDLPYPVFEIDSGADQATLAVTATSIGSVGAGPFQPYRRTWQWNAGTSLFEHGPDILLPSGYRIHAFYAAEDLLKKANPEEALHAYELVIQDNTLSDWADPARERAILSAFARFRILQIYTLTGDQAQAQAAYGALQDFPPGEPGAAFAAAAELYWTEYNASGNREDACQAVEDFAVENKGDIIDPLYFGYANRLYEPDDFCLVNLD